MPSSSATTIRSTTPWSRRSARAPYNEGHFGITSSFTAVLGRMATYSGKVIKWDEAVEKGSDLAADRNFTFESPARPARRRRTIPDRRAGPLQSVCVTWKP